MNLQRAIICDIDGTIAAFDGKHGEEPDFISNQLKYPVANILKVYNLQKRYDISLIFLTARHEKYRSVTEAWLNKHGLSYYEKLYMRPNNDLRLDHIVKQDIYKKHIEPKYDVFFVLEDLDPVVKMWRKMNITCLQVDYGNYC